MLHQVVALLTAFCTLSRAQISPLSKSFIKEINVLNTTWKAGMNFGEKSNLTSVERLMGVLVDSDFYLPPLKKTGPLMSSIRSFPKEFNPMKKWPYCTSISKIKDQGACGSCWAVAAASTMTDRVCIHSRGAVKIEFSATDMISCCRNCGRGCSGGYPGKAWQYWVNHGVTTGGEYGSMEGCKPYVYQPCLHYVDGSRPCCSTLRENTTSCEQTCHGQGDMSYNDSLTFGKSSYSLRQNEADIMKELYENGPVEATFAVHEDFLCYKKGVYQHVKGNFMGRHAAKILGWGEEKGVKYWLMANSWNTDWGDNGFFKILKGSNHCGVERQVVAGLPKLRLENDDEEETDEEDDDTINSSTANKMIPKAMERAVQNVQQQMGHDVDGDATMRGLGKDLLLLKQQNKDNQIVNEESSKQTTYYILNQLNSVK